jgi:hypothetical protein
MEFKPWYSVYKVDMKVRDVLGSIPAEPEKLKYVKNLYQAMLPDSEVSVIKPKDLMDVDEKTYEEIEEKAAGRCIFRKDENGIYISNGMIVGWIEESTKAARLSRKIRNIALTFTTEPRRVYAIRNGEILTKPDREVVRPIKAYVGGTYIVTLSIHECLNDMALSFYLLTTNDKFDQYAEQVFDVGVKMTGIGPGRQHGYGEIVDFKWEKVQ